MIRNTFLTVLRQDLRERMRNKQFYILFGIYLSLIGLLASLAFAYIWANTAFGERDIYFRQRLGNQIFDAVVFSEALLICLICPGLTSASLSDQRERQGVDANGDSLPSARDLVLGKLGSAVTISLILIYGTLPLKCLAYSLGGVDPLWALLSFAIVFIAATFFCSIGLFFSSVTNKPIAAAISSYSAILISTFLRSGSGRIARSLEYFRAREGTIHFLTAFNPVSTAFDTKYLLLDKRYNFWLSTTRLLQTPPIFFPTSWINYFLVYSLLTWLLLKLTIRVLDGSSDGEKFRFWRKGSK